MTIIVTALFPKHVLQVSDRKLSWARGKAIVQQEDRWNKAIVFGDWATIAYTGPARLPDQRTDQWITETISRTTMVDQAINELWEKANDRLQQKQWNPPELAIVVAGWMQDAGKVEPFRAAISNYLLPEGKHGPARDQFNVLMSRQQEAGLGIYIAGRNMPRRNFMMMGRTLKRAYRRGVSMPTMAEVIVNAARGLHDRWIGESFNAVIVPEPVPGRPFRGMIGASQGGPQPDLPLALYFPGPNAGPEYVMPNFGGGGMAVTDISVIPRALTAEEVAERYRAGPPMPRRI
jgi:hypothetical protein